MQHTLHPGAYSRALRALHALRELDAIPHYTDAVWYFLKTYRRSLTPAQARWVSGLCGAPAEFIAETYPGMIAATATPEAC